MAGKSGLRRDSKHRVLRRGESIRANGKYQFKYHIGGKPHCVYSWMFRASIEDRPDYKVEKVVDGYTGFLFLDKDGMPLVAMHWEHRFNHMVSRYNEIYKVQMPNITPHVCRHTYCSNMAKSGMNPKTLQYLMGHSDIAVTLNVYTHVGLEDAEKELQKMQGLENTRKEMGISDTDDKPLKQNMFKVV